MTHYELIVDVLMGFASLDKFNTFIVASVYRVLMRWFIAVPDSDRPAFTAYVIAKLENARPVSCTRMQREGFAGVRRDACAIGGRSAHSVTCVYALWWDDRFVGIRRRGEVTRRRARTHMRALDHRQCDHLRQDLCE